MAQSLGSELDSRFVIDYRLSIIGSVLGDFIGAPSTLHPPTVRKIFLRTCHGSKEKRAGSE